MFILFVFIVKHFPREVHYFASFFNQQYKESRLFVDGRHILRLVVYSRVPTDTSCSFCVQFFAWVLVEVIS